MASANDVVFQKEVSSTSTNDNKKPICIIVLGMAGSGKTTFVQVFYF